MNHFLTYSVAVDCARMMETQKQSNIEGLKRRKRERDSNVHTSYNPNVRGLRF